MANPKTLTETAKQKFFNNIHYINAPNVGAIYNGILCLIEHDGNVIGIFDYYA